MALVNQLRSALAGPMTTIINSFPSMVTWFLPSTVTSSGQVVKSYAPLEGAESVKVTIFDLSRARAQRQYGVDTEVSIQLIVPEAYPLKAGYVLEVLSGFHAQDCFVVDELEHLYAAKIWVCGAHEILRSEINGPGPE